MIAARTTDDTNVLAGAIGVAETTGTDSVPYKETLAASVEGRAARAVVVVVADADETVAKKEIAATLPAGRTADVTRALPTDGTTGVTAGRPPLQQLSPAQPLAGGLHGVPPHWVTWQRSRR